MTKSMLLAIAEAAGLDEFEKPQPAAAAFRPAATPIAPVPVVATLSQHAASVFRPAAAPVIAAPIVKPPVAELSLPEQIIQTWKTDPQIRAQFVRLDWYAAWAKSEAAKAAGVSIAQISAQSPDVSGYLAKRGNNLGPGERATIEGYGATWRASPDIRAEFGTFEVYAAFMRARARGQARILGQ